MLKSQDSITGHATPVPPTRHVTARHVTDARQVTLVSGESRRHLVSPSLCPPYYALLSISNADSTYGFAFSCMPDHSTPVRRSGRFQPIVATSPTSSNTRIVPSALLHTRKSPLQDFLEEDKPSEDASLENYQTHFYQTFSRPSSSARAPIKTYGKSSRPRKSDVEQATVFTIGDTVLVKTTRPDPPQNNRPANGVIPTQRSANVELPPATGR